MTTFNHNIVLLTTSDGSPTLTNTITGENYHSTHGAHTESIHVYINAGLNYVLQMGKIKITILEVGFGTGLNFLLTANEILGKNVQVKYIGIEPYLITPQMLSSYYLQSFTTIDEDLKATFIQWYSSGMQNKYVYQNIVLEIVQHSLLQAHIEPLVDLVYYDAFSFNTQPELWNSENLNKTVGLMSNKSVLVTYCVRGTIKQIFRALNTKIQRLPGAPGKREMLRVLKNF